MSARNRAVSEPSDSARYLERWKGVVSILGWTDGQCLPGTREKIKKRHMHTTHICNTHPNTVFLMTTIPPTPTRSRHHNIRQRSSLFLGKPCSQFSPFYEGKIILEKDPTNESLAFLHKSTFLELGRNPKVEICFSIKNPGLFHS